MWTALDGFGLDVDFDDPVAAVDALALATALVIDPSVGAPASLDLRRPDGPSSRWRV